jgi:hypothetical protein
MTIHVGAAISSRFFRSRIKIQRKRLHHNAPWTIFADHAPAQYLHGISMTRDTTLDEKKALTSFKTHFQLSALQIAPFIF